MGLCQHWGGIKYRRHLFIAGFLPPYIKLKRLSIKYQTSRTFTGCGSNEHSTIDRVHPDKLSHEIFINYCNIRTINSADCHELVPNDAFVCKNWKHYEINISKYTKIPLFKTCLFIWELIKLKIPQPVVKEWKRKTIFFFTHPGQLPVSHSLRERFC